MTENPLGEKTLFHSRLSIFPNNIHELRNHVLSRFLYDYYGDGPWWRDLFGIDEFLTIRRQWPQVVVAVVICVIAVYIDCVAQVYLQLNYVKTHLVLTDLGFQFLPYWDNVHASDYVVLGFIAVTFLRFLVFTGPMSMRWTIMRRTILCLGTLFFLRGFSIICTVLPNPAKYCVSDVPSHKETSVALQAWYILLGWRVTCADVLYSGHTVNLTLCLLVWWNYSHLCPIRRCSNYTFPFGKTFATIWCVLGYMLIIITHFHYTVDVWLGFWMSYFVWNYYHEAIKSSPFFATHFFNFLTWMEMETTDLHYWRLRVQKIRSLDEDIKNFRLRWKEDDRELNSGTYLLLERNNDTLVADAFLRVLLEQREALFRSEQSTWMLKSQQT
eukprot:GEMP01027584.1.p1 GENE.GEMP01027584.1~~GEMP01027584.1.p1  ORF type:complete len:384 (+),score=36.57 GEMP01027584.1:118-1269(+)